MKEIPFYLSPPLQGDEMQLSSYYSRQIKLAEVGTEGQEKLNKSRCLVIGAGGLGCPALLYLASTGVGKIGICDGDLLEESNLHRQPLYFASDVGKPKAKLAEERLKQLNPSLQLVSYPFRLTAQNGPPLFSLYDLILDCTDNFQTKFLINDLSFFSQKPLIRASIYQFEGQIQTYLPERKDACLRCLWEETPSEGCVGSCQEVGVLGPVPGYFGVLQALEAIKYFLGLPILEANQVLFVDLLNHRQYTISLNRRADCPLCGKTPLIRSLSGKEAWEIEFSHLKEGSFQLIDIRESEEVARDPYPSSPVLKMPLSVFNASSLEPSQKYALFCQRGKRSSQLVRTLRARGFMNLFSLIGGMESVKNLEYCN